ncbi:glycosyltransferase [Chryseobacterium sp. GMJ5]|uniref:Glycosyltransferase n=1 Tax=Chryseobacterium gilvum TaxID=2976534 RepID=A0ABT2VWW2_9FLAO|nr:glycosyltransferase [Chryseobacterium gilvum]MCU7614250.1 glycosyltransferase [Chryseobacterium gilvum]
MENPLVTVIVVSYNHSKYIKENLDSIKNQTYDNIQLIVGDDASKDNSVEVFQQWLQENNYPAITNFHRKNTGLATMLNECVTLAEGKYIKIIAADDFLHPESIAKCVEKLETLGESYGMVFTDTYAIDSNSKIAADIADYNTLGNVSSEVFKKELIKSNRIAALTVLMRTEALHKTGEYKSDLLIEDYYRWLKINALYNIAYIPQKLSYYRLHEENVSQTKIQRIESESVMLQMLFDEAGENRQKINSFTSKKYLNQEKLSSEFLIAYRNYPFSIKRLSFALHYKIPVSIYQFFNKIL